MAALSVQSCGGGTTTRKPCARRGLLQRRLEALIGGDAARHHQGALRVAPQPRHVDVHGLGRAVAHHLGHGVLEAGAEIGDRLPR